MNQRNRLRLALAVIAAAAIGYGQWRQRSDSASTPPRTLAAPIATNAKQFMLGTLAFKACELPQRRSGATTAAYCAPFAVAENPDEPGGRRIDLNLALVKAEAEAADSDLVVLLAGGPGQAAIESWPRIAPAFAALRKHHHVLLLDQRGTGGSNAMTCSGADNPAGNDADIDAVRQRTRNCLEQAQRHADPRFYTTTLALGDLEALRQALGAPQFDLVGISYGTRVAQQYLARYPGGVRSAVLDSVAPNELVLGEDFAANLESALKAQFALCAQAPDCAKAFPDPYADLLRLRDALRTHPQELDFPDPVSYAPAHLKLDGYTLAGIVRMFAYSPETAALLPLSVAEGLRGNYAPLAGQAQLLASELSELEESGMQLSVLCAEDADLLAPRPQDSAMILGTILVDVIRAQCAIWPKGDRPADFHAPLRSDKPILVLEGELDPVTPPRYGEQVMQGLSNARLLIARGQGHNVIGRGCMPRLVSQFVDALAPKTLDASCADALGPIPPFTGFNGAAP